MSTSVKNAKHLEALWLNISNTIAQLRRFYPITYILGKFEIGLIEELRQNPKIISKEFYTKNIVDINQLMEEGLVHWVEPVSGSGRILAEDFEGEMTLEITAKGGLGANPVDTTLQILEGELDKFAEFIRKTAPKGSLTYESCMKPKPKQKPIEINYKTAYMMAVRHLSNMTEEELQKIINDNEELRVNKLAQYAISSNVKFTVRTLESENEHEQI